MIIPNGEFSMKKIIAVLLAVTLLAAIACATVSAEIRFYDPFDTWTSYWFGYGRDDQGGDLNVITKVNGENVLEGWEEARVHQGMYSDNEITGKGYANSGSALITGTVWVDLRCEDTDSESSAGLWWKNTYHETHENADGSDTFLLYYFPSTSTVKFFRDFPGAETDEERLIVSWNDPKSRGNNINGDKITLGLRVESGKISAFVDGEWIGSFDDATLGNDPCPILLWNNGLHAIWDNFYVGDLAELPLPGSGGQQGGGQQGGNQGGQQGGNQGGAQQGGGTEKVIVKKSVVVGTDAEGNAITEIVTEEVVRQVAATGGTATGGNAAKTGDAAIIVIAVMVAALGAAIVVKKVTSK